MVAVFTGPAGLIGAEAVRLFAVKGLEIVRIAKDMDEEVSTSRQRLEAIAGYRHRNINIRDKSAVLNLFANRAGDHIWSIGDIRRFQGHYPGLCMRYDFDATLGEIFDAVADRAFGSQLA